MSLVRIAPLLAAASLAACTATPPESPAITERQAPVKHHVVAVVSLTADGPRVIARRKLEGPPQIDRAPQRSGWRVEIEDEGGELLHSAYLRPVTDIRGEFPGEDGRIEAVRIPHPAPVVTLRLPALKGAARVKLFDERPLVDGQGKVQDGRKETLAELEWSEVAP